MNEIMWRSKKKKNGFYLEYITAPRNPNSFIFKLNNKKVFEKYWVGSPIIDKIALFLSAFDISKMHINQYCKHIKS